MRKNRGYILACLLASHVCTAAQDNATHLQAVEVYDEDGSGIESRVFRIKDDETLEWFGNTDVQGQLFFDPPLACATSKRILVKPKNPLRFETPAYGSCKKMVVFRARRWKRLPSEIAKKLSERRIVENLLYHAESALQEKNHGPAALVYTELSVRFSNTAPDIARTFRDEAYLNAGIALDVERPVILKLGGALGLSSEFRSRLIEYQRDGGIKQTGHLDRATLSAIANDDYSAFLFYRTPGVGGPDKTHDTDNFVSISPDELGRSIHFLRTNSQRALANRDFGLAAQLYTELSGRLRLPSQQQSYIQAVEAEKQGYMAAGAYFNIEKSMIFDRIQGKSVMSEFLVEAIRRFQVENNLLATGVLDYNTLRIMSRRDISEYLIRIVEH